MSKKSKEQKIIVSNLLKDKLDSLFPLETHSKERSVACKIISFISNKSVKTTGVDTSYIEFGSRLLRKIFSSRAQSVLNTLKNEGILLCFKNETTGKEQYYTKNKMVEITKNESTWGICKKYSLNSIFSLYKYKENNNKRLEHNLPLILSPEAVEVSFETLVKRGSKKVFSSSDKKSIKDFYSYVGKLDIDYKKLKEVCDKKVQSIDIEDFKLNEEIVSDKFEVTFLNSNKKLWMSREAALNVTRWSGETLIQDNKKYYIGTKSKFLTYKKNHLTFSYRDSIKRLENKDLYSKVNHTNNRLDTNFTNLATFMFDEICKQNNLVQGDLSNSQFAILAHLMEKEGIKSSNFYKAAYNGTLYDESMEILGFNKRSEAKNVFFEVVFCKDSTNTELKRRVLKGFPEVINFIERVKKSGKYQDMAIMLQKEEAKIFIEGLYPRLQEQVELVFTKHDSIIVKEEDKNIAKMITEEYFKEIGFKGNMTWN